MPSPERIQEAGRLTREFGERTGLTSDDGQQRYLWTDAFAVCNLLGLAEARGEPSYAQAALDCIDRVHRVLGRHRADDSRRGWLSGDSERSGEAHPTRGGLRIGKSLPERAPGQIFDERLEWERDGQYFHYLTRWMHALDQTARATGHAHLNLWARELADTAHRAFTSGAPRGPDLRMAWKMSIDLSRPLVASMGQHDPLDGLITCLQLRTTAAMLGVDGGPDLEQATADFAEMTRGQDLVTADALGLGGLLADACRLTWLISRGAPVDPRLLGELLAAAEVGLAYYVRQGELNAPPARRLAFRELGLAIGLQAIPRVLRAIPLSSGVCDPRELSARVAALEPYVALGQAIESFWLDPDRRQSRSWLEHRDINDVMLATCLVPGGYLLAAHP